MSSPAKQPPVASKKAATSGGGGGGGWGSLLSGAVAGLESRLDTILADDNEASAKARAAEQASRSTTRNTTRTTLARSDSGNLRPPTRDVGKGDSRDASRTRVNDRLAERLAKATASKTPSRTGSPAVGESVNARDSGEEPREDVVVKSVPDIVRTEEPGAECGMLEAEEGGRLLSSGLPINPARVSVESLTRPSTEATRSEVSSRPSMDLPNGTAHKSAAGMEADMVKMREDQAMAEKQRQEEMHTYLEKIDALQAKLSYLAQSTVAAAKEANASTSTNSNTAKLAEKDEKIATLMEEGEKLSKKELKHLQALKKLRAKAAEEEKAILEVRKKLDKSETSEKDLKLKLRRLDTTEREKTKAITAIEKQVEELHTDRENAAELVRSLTTQLKESKTRADKAEKDSKDIDKNKLATLQNDLEDAQIEKKLAEDRASTEVNRVHDELDSARQRFSVRELELNNEVAGLESRLEALRTRAEEEGVSGGGEVNVKLMRQVETLQGQYAVAKENWEAIESSLNARLGVVERERDESQRREGEVRRKVREVGTRARNAEGELEAAMESAIGRHREVEEQMEIVRALQVRLEHSEAAVVDMRGEFERQQKVWEEEVKQRVEEERMKWQRGVAQKGISRNESPAANSGRKPSTAEVNGLRRQGTGNRLDLSTLQTDYPRPTSKRSSHKTPEPHPGSATRAQQQDRSADPSPPILSRQESTLSFVASKPDLPPETPSIELDIPFEVPETPASAGDLVSTAFAPTTSGVSVQLVERMSAAVRRLESEKAAFKDEIARLSTQRDSARDEVVSLMREVEAKRDTEKRVEELEKLKGRYEASLEMLGEREEEVQELKGDVGELKRLYRELVEEKMGGK